MCILCVIQKWSWRVATMLPWLVIPLIGLWALSQLLPLPYRFEVTGPRLACVFVLLITLVWYQYLMPCLSAWRVRRNAQLRERKRFEAFELQKLRKTATKRCRNCYSPYRDQNPGGGRYMCSYCGHLSKRPVLDLPIPSGLGNAGIIKELFGKGGKILNGKVWSDNSSISHGWVDSGDWVTSASFPGRPGYASGKSNTGFFRGSEQCVDEKSHPHASFLSRIWMTSFLKSIRWTCRKLFRISSLIEDEVDQMGMFAKRGNDGTHCQESRAEKARRKAEERRQARLEKELLEEEERKQKEEVARMVEERRRLRDEKTEAENRARGSCQREEKKKEAEKRRQDRRKDKDKDKSSSKSNSDVEEIMEKKLGRENERRVDSEKKTEIAQKECQRSGSEVVKGNCIETTSGGKRSPTNNYGHGNAGTRYFDRMRGTIISSSKVFTSGSFFGKASRAPTHVLKDKSNGSLDHVQPSSFKRDPCPPERVQQKFPIHGDDRITNGSAGCEPQRKTAPKSWQQLFTKSPTAPALNTDMIGRPNTTSLPEVNNSHIPPSPPPLTYDNPINFGFSSPFTIPTFPNGPMNVSSGLVAKDNSSTHLGEFHNPLPEEPELFEDPCYVPDPVSLLGPVSESLHNFQLDLGSGFVPQEIEKPRSLISTSVPLDTSRPYPIGSPISPMRVADERQNYFGHAPCSPKAQELEEFNSVSEKGLWQMWNTSPVLQDGLACLGNRADWISPLEWSRPPNMEDAIPVPQKTMASLFANERPLLSGTHAPQTNFLGNGQTNGVFGSPVPVSNGDLWMQKSFPEPFADGEDRSPVKTTALNSQKNTVYRDPIRASTNDSSLAMARGSYWSQNELSMRNRSNEGVVGNPPSVATPSVEGGGLYYTPDVQSLRFF